MTNLIPLWLKVKDFPEEFFLGQTRKIFDFIREGVSEQSANSVGMSWENAIAIGPNWTMAHIAKEIGLFPSVNQARKNGWSRDIETGFSERGGLGKQKLICFFIWNPDPLVEHSSPLPLNREEL
jgi:hypothetical protein